MTKILLLIVVIGLIVFAFFGVKTDEGSFKEKLPGILAKRWDAIKTFFGKTWDIFKNAFLKAWQGAVTLWTKMWLWMKKVWESFIVSTIDLVAERIKTKFR